MDELNFQTYTNFRCMELTGKVLCLWMQQFKWMFLQPQSPLTAIDYEMLRAEIDPLRNTTQYGIDIYEEVLSFVISKV